MAIKAKEQAVIDLVINGQQANSSLRELTGAYNALFAQVSRLREADDPEHYRQQVAQLAQVRAARDAERASIMATTQAVQQQESVNKGFFADFKEGFSEITEMAGRITAGTLIYKGVSAIIGGIKDLFNGSEAAYEEAQLTQTALQNKLRQTGEVAGESQQHLEKLQQTWMDITGVDDDVIAKGEDVLLTYTNIRGQIYDQSIPTLVSLTAAMNGNKVTMEGITSTADIYGKILDNVTKAKKGLRAIGITETEEQEKEIATRVRNNDVMGAQQILIDIINSRYGNLAKTLADTDVGSLQKFATTWDNLKEKIGQTIVEGKSWLADFFQPFIEGLVRGGDNFQNLTDEFYKQRDAVQGLQQNTLPLIARYEELQSKGELNKKEQVEMNTIINTLAETIPTAVTEWDKYGNAIGINTTKAREFIAMQQAMLKIKNKEAIDESEDTVKSLEARANRIQGILSYGKTTIAGGRISDSATDVQQRDLTPKEITDYSNQLKAIKTQVDDLKLGIKGLQGENIVIPTAKVNKPTGGKTEEELLAEAKQAEANEKARKQFMEHSKAMSDLVKDFNAEELSSLVAKNDKEIQVTESKYDRLINAEKNFIEKNKDNKFADPQELAKHQDEIDKLTLAKNDQVNKIRERQEQEITDKIAVFNQKLTGKLETELQKDTDNINAYYDGLVKDAGTNQDQVAQIEVGRAAALADAKINEEKRFQVEKNKIAADGLVSSADIDQLEIAKINKKYDDEIQALKDKFSEEEQATLDFQDAIAAINSQRQKALDDENEKKAKKKASEEREFAIESAQKISDSVFTISNRNRQTDTDNKIKALEDQKEKELSNTNLTADQKAAITEKYAKQEAEIKQKAWEADKAAAIEQAIINGALAVGKALAQVGPLGAFVIPGIIAETAAQVALIASQPAPEFAKGGILAGPSHADGGLNVVDPKTGQTVVNVEGGEPFMVLSKETRRNNGALINQLLFNSMFRNGAAVDVAGVDKGIQVAKNGGVFSAAAIQALTGRQSDSFNNGSSPAVNNQVDLSELVQEMRATREAIKDQKVIFNDRVYDQYKQRKLLIQNTANG